MTQSECALCHARWLLLSDKLPASWFTRAKGFALAFMRHSDGRQPLLTDVRHASTGQRGWKGGGGCSLGVEPLSSIVQPTVLSPSSTKKKTYSLLTELLGQQVGKLTG